MRKDYGRNRKLHKMNDKYVRAYLKPGTALININVSEDGFPSSERNYAAYLEASEARQIVKEFLEKGYLLYETFVSLLWDAGEAMQRKPYWNQTL